MTSGRAPGAGAGANSGSGAGVGVGTLVRGAVRGATALRGGRTWRPGPYAVFGFLFWLVMSLAYWRVPMCCDFGTHAAVVERLKANLLHPLHPMADVPGAGSPYYSPYAVAQGIFARVTGFAGWEVVKLTGPLNLLVLLTGVGRFTRVLTSRQWAPVLALLAMTLLWGTRVVWWSGFPSLLGMTGNMAYPSMFAIGLSFWAWAWTGSLAGRSAVGPSDAGRSGGRSWWAYAGLGVLCGLILLVHPMTAVAAAAGVFAFALPALRRAPWRWALTVAVALAIAVSWPYFDVLTLGTDANLDAVHVLLYRGMPVHYWLALAALPALWVRLRRDRLDPLAVMFVLDCLIVAYGWLSGHYTYGRVLGLTLVGPQFALAVELAAPRPWAWWRRVLGVGAAGAACVGFLVVQAGAVLQFAPFQRPPRWPSYTWAAQYIPPGDVVLTNGYKAMRSLPAFGPNLVAPPWPDPALAEQERKRRVAAVRAYLSPGSTQAERTGIARRYGVHWLLLSREQRLPREAVVVRWSPRTGEVLARVNGGSPRVR
ncbi:hypothetical protein [Streptomyces sp. NPDC046821]|uniref:hypothetical protein n=1 Tax=Streptomyces sp. NPDC046821 TaxID=3154702 RepID=UPI0034061C8E